MKKDDKCYLELRFDKIIEGRKKPVRFTVGAGHDELLATENLKYCSTNLYQNIFTEAEMREKLTMGKPKVEFKVGDIVRDGGVVGKVAHVDSSMDRVFVEFEVDGETKSDYYTFDGRTQPWHKEPSLEILSRPKKKYKIKVFALVDDNGDIAKIYTEKMSFVNVSHTVVELEKEVEI
jgi:hypothetical protein